MNNYGRSILLKDLKFLKGYLDPLLKIHSDSSNFNATFTQIEEYLNIWYSDEGEILSFVENTVSAKLIHILENKSQASVKHYFNRVGTFKYDKKRKKGF